MEMLAVWKAWCMFAQAHTRLLSMEEEVRRNLDRYAEFIGANASYVVSEALKLLFKRDDDFKHWLSDHPTKTEGQKTLKGDVFTKTV
jgi:hypothetical protein